MPKEALGGLISQFICGKINVMCSDRFERGEGLAVQIGCQGYIPSSVFEPLGDSPVTFEGAPEMIETILRTLEMSDKEFQEWIKERSDDAPQGSEDL